MRAVLQAQIDLTVVDFVFSVAKPSQQRLQINANQCKSMQIHKISYKLCHTVIYTRRRKLRTVREKQCSYLKLILVVEFMKLNKMVTIYSKF